MLTVKMSEISKANTADSSKPVATHSQVELRLKAHYVPQHGDQSSCHNIQTHHFSKVKAAVFRFSEGGKRLKYKSRRGEGWFFSVLPKTSAVVFCYIPSDLGFSLWGKVADFTAGCSHWKLKSWIYMPVLHELTVCFHLKLQVTQAEAPNAHEQAVKPQSAVTKPQMRAHCLKMVQLTLTEPNNANRFEITVKKKKKIRSPSSRITVSSAI